MAPSSSGLLLLLSLPLLARARNASRVLCGEELAASCAECPDGRGKAWCKGDCVWYIDACVDRSRLDCEAARRSGGSCIDWRFSNASSARRMASMYDEAKRYKAGEALLPYKGRGGRPSGSSLQLSAKEVYSGTGVPAIVYVAGPWRPDALIEWNSKQFPPGTEFKYYDYKAMVEEMVIVDELLKAEDDWLVGADGKKASLLDAFLAYRPISFRVDLFRFAVVWRTGGIYLDGKMKLIQSAEEWIAPSSLTMCPDVSSLTNYGEPIADTIPGYRMWHHSTDLYTHFAPPLTGMFSAPPRNPVLFAAMMQVVAQVARAEYPEFGWHSDLFPTGPGRLGIALAQYSQYNETYQDVNGSIFYFSSAEPVYPRRHVATLKSETICGSTFVIDESVHAEMRACNICNPYGDLFSSNAMYCANPTNPQFYDPCLDREHWAVGSAAADWVLCHTQLAASCVSCPRWNAESWCGGECSSYNGDCVNGNQTMGTRYHQLVVVVALVPRTTVLAPAATAAAIATTETTATSTIAMKATQTSAAQATSSLAPAFLGTVAPDALWAQNRADLADVAKYSAVLLGLFGTCGLYCACCRCVLRRLCIATTAKPYSAVASEEATTISARSQPDSVDPSTVGSTEAQSVYL